MVRRLQAAACRKLQRCCVLPLVEPTDIQVDAGALVQQFVRRDLSQVAQSNVWRQATVTWAASFSNARHKVGISLGTQHIVPPPPLTLLFRPLGLTAVRFGTPQTRKALPHPAQPGSAYPSVGSASRPR